MDPFERFDDYTIQVKARLHKGREEYGDENFSSDPLSLLDEIQEELLDVTAWGYVLWHRLEGLRKRLREEKTHEGY